MNNSKVSVIIPLINENSGGIRETINSVLHQSYQDYEIIVTGNFSRQFSASFEDSIDSKLRFVNCAEKEEALAKNNGIKAASGELIQFLLPGNICHPEKIREHMRFRKDHPEAIITYNPHFIIGKGGNVWINADISTDPDPVNLIINLPIALSDMVINKDWIYKTGMFTSEYGSRGSDIEFIYRFILENNKVFGIEQRLNSNLITQEFFFNDQDSEFDGMILALEKFFSDERCPKQLKIKQAILMSKIYTNRALLSLFRGETSKGQEWIRKAIRLDRSILDDQAAKFLRLLTIFSLMFSEDFEPIFRNIIYQLPQELEWISKYLDPSIARGYLISSVLDIFWGREQQADSKFKKAKSYKINIDLRFQLEILKQISSYQTEFGVTATNNVVKKIGKHLVKIGQFRVAHWLVGTFNINQAFRNYYNNRYAEVPSYVMRAIIKQPNLIFNQGVLSIFYRSYLNNWKYIFKVN